MPEQPTSFGANMTRRQALAVAAASVAAAALPVAAPAEAAIRPPASLRPAEVAVAFACRSCGSTHVTRDAWAEWDTDLQEWVLGAVYDHAYCHDCDDDTRLIRIDPATRAPISG